MQLDPAQEDRIATLEKTFNPSVSQKNELKFLTSLRWVKTRTVRGREAHVKQFEAVDVPTEGLMTMDRFDVPLIHKLPDAKIKHILDFHTEVPSRQIKSAFACVTSSSTKEEEFKKRHDC